MAIIKQLHLRGSGLRAIRSLKTVGSALKWVVLKIWAICFRIKVKLLTKWRGTKKESPKVITFEPSIWRASKKCAIHLLPITAIAILAALNIATYFIGAEYQGSTTTIEQGFDNLALQVTAKLYELLIIASLSTVLMDVLRYELLYSSTGLPFGILTANTQFVDFLIPLLVVCTILALLCSMSWSEPPSSVANKWFETEGNTINTTSFPEQNSSSAYLSIQVPLHNGKLGLSCTIDARWAYGQIIAQGAAQVNLPETYTPVFVPNWGPDFDGWRLVRFARDWLNSLTPQLGNVTTWNSLSSTLTELGVDNSTGSVGDTWDTVAFISQLLVSATIVDVMSRAGYDLMNSLQAPTLNDSVLDAAAGGPDTLNDSVMNAILEGSYILYTDDSNGANASDQLQMHWSITATGLGYRANSLSYYLALALLFTTLSLLCRILSGFSTTGRLQEPGAH
ncbi:uncharacterized protein LY89DRAFT_675474 [Mollisia scopiformis]|uniref:Transmembrane protein n=1 Tax=Mollisia scopiformis TaxID=149040 RepID=A0A132BE74_MOLSC|nr:uncharacterized protein LY89DRAFT_675474 [Mollisia scopiformis]KUJ09967.1 hypothetical protein LY89DRAFT_675474 [Mollisia scopiformis]